MRAIACDSVEVLSAAAVVAARSRLDPARRSPAAAGCGWVRPSELVLMIHHLAVDGVSWRILLEDLSIAWAQHHGGQPMALPRVGRRSPRWASLLAEHARSPAVVDQAEAWRQMAVLPGVLPGWWRAVDTFANAGRFVGRARRRHDSHAVG